MVGVDLSRFVAIFGMCNIHLGVPFLSGGLEQWVTAASSGRATALFTFLAGVSLAMMSGRQQPLGGDALRTVRVRVAVRAGLLIVLGWVLAIAAAPTGFLLTVILPFYGAYFFLALPFLRLGARGAAVASATIAVLGPQVSFVLRTWIDGNTPISVVVRAVDSVDPGHLLAHQGLFDVLLLDYYPALSSLALILAGLAVGRLDLRSPGLRWRLATGGAVLAVVAYSVAGLLLVAVGGPSNIPAEGVVPVGHPGDLVTAAPHSGTTFELAGSLGVSMVVLMLCLELSCRAERIVAPLAMAGSMALTLYSVHTLVMAWEIVVGGWPLSGAPGADAMAALATSPARAQIPNMPWLPADGHGLAGVPALICTYMPEIFLVTSVLFAVAWRKAVGRGPLEWLFSEVSGRTSRQLLRAEAGS